MRKPRPGTVFLFLWGLFLSGAVAVYLAYLQPSQLGRTVSETLNASLGVRVQIRQVNLSLFPNPAIIIEGLSLKPGEIENLNLRTASCRAELSWLSIVRFKPVIRAVEFDGPVADIILPLKPRAASASAPKPETTALAGSGRDESPAVSAVPAKDGEASPASHNPAGNGVAPEQERRIPTLPPMLAGIRVTVTNGEVRVRQENASAQNVGQNSGQNAAETSTPSPAQHTTQYTVQHTIQHTVQPALQFTLNGINGSARLPGLFRGEADLNVQAATFHFAKAPAISVTNFSFKAASVHTDRTGDLNARLTLTAGVQMDSLDETLGHTIHEAFRYFPMPEPMQAGLELDVNARPAERLFSVGGRLDIAALLPMNGHNTPIKIRMPFTMTSADAISVNGMTLTMDGDSGVIQGELKGLTALAPVFTGRLDMHHFSLIRWFGFGRRMSAGLQNALNNITGSIDFVLTPQGVTAPRLQARVLDMTLNGYGSCTNFREPDILISGKLGNVDLNPLFPEINGQTVSKPDLPPPALPLIIDDTPARVGYDIHITADKADIWKLSVGGIDCHIVPAEIAARTGGPSPITLPSYTMLSDKALGKRPTKGALLQISVANAYGGKGESFVHLAEPDRVVAAMTDVSLEAPSTRLASYAALGGKLKANADITFIGTTAGRLTSTLAGTIDASVGKGFFGSKEGSRLPFQSLSIQANAKAAPAGRVSDELPHRMDYAGQWKVSLDTEDWTLSTNSPAVLAFSMSNGLPVAMKPQPASFRLRLDKNGPGIGVWPADLILDLNGQTSFDIDAGTIAFTDISGGRTGLALGGSLRAHQIFRRPITEGRLTAKTSNLKDITPLFGLTLPETRNPSMFKTLSFEGDVRLDGNSAKFQNIQSRLDRTTITGSTAVTFGKRPFWSADLIFDTFDVDAYRPVPDKNSNTPVPADMLTKFELDARLSGRRVTVASTPLVNIKLPLTLKQGVLRSEACTAAFPGGGSLTANLNCVASPGIKDPTGKMLDGGSLASRLELRLAGINMLPLTQERGQDTLMAGTGAGQLDLQATLKTWGDIPRKLDGNWSFEVRSGYIVSAKAAAEAAARGQAGGNTNGFGLSPQQSQSTAPARTSFDSITASGSILAGLVRSTNFRLRGAMLTITGGGVIDLNSETINAKATATLLGVPEMPVTITGSISNPKTTYQIVGAVAGTIGNIGGTVLDIVGNVLTAPFRLFLGKKTP